MFYQNITTIHKKVLLSTSIKTLKKIGIWEKIYVENESASITGRYCYLGYMLTTYKGYYADSFTRNPRTRFTVSIKWNKDGNFECRNAQ